MRTTTVFKRLLRLCDVNVTSVIWGTNVVTFVVALKRRRLWCPHCTFKTSAHDDQRPRLSRWRHLDLHAHGPVGRREAHQGELAHRRTSLQVSRRE